MEKGQKEHVRTTLLNGKGGGEVTTALCMDGAPTCEWITAGTQGISSVLQLIFFFSGFANASLTFENTAIITLLTIFLNLG